MKVLVGDILKFLKSRLSSDEVKDALERSGVEVEKVEKVGDSYDLILPARALKVTRKGRIFWTEVDIEGTRRKVATTDPVEEGEILLWTNVPPKTIDGRTSEGMFLSAKELGLEDQSEHLLRIEDPKNYREEALLDEVVLHLYITPNRPDLLSVRGLALEVSAFADVPFVDLRVEERADLNESFPVEVEDERCDLYTLRVIRLRDGKTPKLIRYKLHLVGFNAINPAVDATNWVAYYLGQPLHAFDARRVVERIIVRRSKEGERFVSLEGKEYVLPEGILLIADTQKPLAIGGVIGGADSGTYEDTEVIYLESAHFLPEAVRFATTSLNIETESSRRFERNVSPRLALLASVYAAELLKEWVGASYGRPNVVGDVRPPRKIFVSFEKLRKYLGFIPEDLQTLLGKLRIEVVESKENGVVVKEPDHRTDIGLQEDVIEEIARLIGYDNLPSDPPPESPLQPRPRDRYEDEVRVHLASLGAYEVIPLGLFSKEEVEGFESLRVISDFNRAFSYLTDAPPLHILKALSHNQRMGNPPVPLFSIVRIYQRDGTERKFVVLGIGSPATYYHAKHFLDSLKERFGWEFVYKVPSSDSIFHPNLSADILSGDRKVGGIGAIRFRIMNRFDLNRRAFVWYVELLPKGEVMYRKFSPYAPSVKDFSFLVPLDVLFQDVDSYIKEIVKDLPVEDVRLMDIYEGDRIPKGYRSFTYRFVIRPQEGPLSGDELQRIIDVITERLERRFHLRR
ncbi:MAG: phenylalanine--tRNA ligase subunit beta [Thermotogae bacterium]|nr:phenylalanine--tRNA ligase subunit beta [Thermotogota bacterium]